MHKLKIAINGYGVIGERVADAVAIQDDMEISGVCEVSPAAGATLTQNHSQHQERSALASSSR